MKASSDNEKVNKLMNASRENDIDLFLVEVEREEPNESHETGKKEVGSTNILSQLL